MTQFDMKEWLDSHVVPLLEGPPPLSIYHPFWNGVPPKDVLILLMADTPPADAKCERCSIPKNIEAKGIDCMQTECLYPEYKSDPSAWPRSIKNLIDNHNFRFDYTREPISIAFEGGIFNAFGCDGAPILDKRGMTSARLFRKESDGIGLILQVACKYEPSDDLTAGQHAAAAAKAFYAQFDDNPLEVCQKYGAIFGQA